MKNPLILFSILLTLASYAQESEQLKVLFREIDSINDSFSTGNAIWRGTHPEKYTFLTSEYLIEKAKQLDKKLNELMKAPENKLSDQDQINRLIKIMQLENEVSQVNYRMYLIPFNSEGGFFNQASFFLPGLPFNTFEDYQAYLQWLPSYASYIQYNQNLLRQGIKEKVQAPKVIVRNIISLLDPWTKKDHTAHPFYDPVKRLPSILSEDQKAEITRQAEKILTEQILPAYLDLKAFLETKYLKSAPEKVGVSEIKNGKAYYENRIRHFTTLDISPDSVFQTGQSEVKRIKSLMQQIIDDLGFQGSFTDFIHFLRTDPQFYPQSGQELLNKAAWLSKKAEGQLPKLFSKLYELPFTVESVPEAIAPNYTGGRYVEGSRSQNKPGIYWVNTYNLPSRTYYTLPALTLHEAVPGHHLQITFTAENEGLPDFRKNYYISAFGEGWGLYSEYLGEEMGMYTTPYELFGRYTYEMWRACRLVVDVGLHYKGWTREQAVSFMAENTALSLHEVNTEIDRYIGWPAQAVSYKIGELAIRTLRSKAEQELGDKFDIQKFHNVILKNGSVPLLVLKKEVNAYIESEK